MIQKGLRVELSILAALVAGACIVGLATGYTLFLLIAVLTAYIVYLLKSLATLERWVVAARDKSIKSNPLGGVHGEIIEDIVSLAKRYRDDKRRLQALILRIQDMASALSNGVVLIDKSGNIEWWNQPAKDLLGFKPVDRGHKLTNIIRHPSFVHYFEQEQYAKPLQLKGARRANQHIQFNIYFFGRGERLVTLTDVSRMVMLESMRRDFIANVSHEMRTPLTVIRGYLETLNSFDEVPQKVWKKAMGSMEQQCSRMTALVNDLITLSELETAETEHKKQSVHVYPLLKAIMSDAAAITTPELHTLNVDADENLIIKGNEKELHSAVSNLVINAVKYSPEGGKITAYAEVTQQEVVIRITDTGPGIGAKHLPRLTERFYRVEDSRNSQTGGTGLGLAIVKHVLLRHDGELKISSKVGVGSTFSCLFSTSCLISPKPSPA